MSKLINAVEIEIWPVSKLMDAASNDPEGNSKVTIPEFQRRLVWSKTRRKELINSIKQGFPFGSVLLYEDVARGYEKNDGKKYFSLIDGLQRTQALKSYVEHQNGYFERADLNDEFVDGIALQLGKTSADYKDRIRQAVVDWVKGRKSYDAQAGWRKDSLVLALIDNVLRYSKDSILYKNVYFDLNNNDKLTNLLGQFLNAVSNEVKLVLDAKVPVLVFSGASKQLPEIFERLNSKGTVLSRYEIFAAQWIDSRRRISNPEIISAIWKKYESLEEEGFTLEISEDAQDEEARKNRVYTLFDYLFGFGHYLSDKYPLMFKPVKDDRPSSSGFNLVTACVGLHVGDMADLPDKIANYDLTELEGCLLESVRFVNKILKPILSAKRFASKPPVIYHSELMIVSIIASAFQVRYSLMDLTDNPDWKKDRRILKRQLLMHYLYDILHDDWRGSGDSKLFDTVKSLRYLQNKPPTISRWQQVLDDWYLATQNDYVHDNDAKRHVRESRSEYLLLRFIFSNRIENEKTFHIEHIIPIRNLQDRMTKGEQWPINTIGNIALLPRAGELKDNTHTYDKLLQAKRANCEISAEQYSAQLEEYSQQLLCRPSILPKTSSKGAFEDFLMQRWDLLKAEFFRVWHNHIPPDPQD